MPNEERSSYVRLICKQLAEFELQIKSSYKPETDPEDLCDLAETIKDFNETYIDV